MPEPTTKKPTICFVSFSPIADDARVRRHGDTLHANGWTVVAVGLPGAKSKQPPWTIIERLPSEQDLTHDENEIVPAIPQAQWSDALAVEIELSRAVSGFADGAVADTQAREIAPAADSPESTNDIPAENIVPVPRYEGGFRQQLHARWSDAKVELHGRPLHRKAATIARLSSRLASRLASRGSKFLYWRAYRGSKFLYWRTYNAVRPPFLHIGRFIYWRSHWLKQILVEQPLEWSNEKINHFNDAVSRQTAVAAWRWGWIDQPSKETENKVEIWEATITELRKRLVSQFESSTLNVVGIRKILPHVQSWREFWPYLPLLKAHIDREQALKIYWSWQNMQEMYEKARHVDADIWIANDWSTLPIVARIVEEKGGIYFYDSHEFATEEYPNNPQWVAFTKPIAKAVEAKYIGGSRKRFAVSPGIAAALNTLYRLDPPCEVLRNMPSRQDLSFRETGAVIRVLYHGILSPERGLEAAIASVPLWKPEFRLTIRGPGSPTYLASLRKLIRRYGVGDRVELAPPVPMIELIRAAKNFDLGFFALPDNSPHNKYALPNKFFEYINSGLALCVTNCPDMADLVSRYRVGILLPTTEPEDIAAAINSLDRKAIDTYKKNSIDASNELCWQAESSKLLQACDEAKLSLS